MKAKKYIFISLMAVMAATSAKAMPSGHDLESVIDQNDLIEVKLDGSNVPAQFQPLINAFGLMSMGCTGTHIGNGLVISAGHCFDASNFKVNQSCDGVSVDWGVREQSKGYLNSKCTRILAMVEDEATNQDYALFQVSPTPPVRIPVELNLLPLIGDKVTIFSHPQMMPLRWSGFCSLAITPSGKGYDSSANIRHQCDTMPGSSGAAIINARTLKIVGVHDRGTGYGGRYNGGTYIAMTALRQILALYNYR